MTVKIEQFRKVAAERGAAAAAVGAAKNLGANLLPVTELSKARVGICEKCPYGGLDRRTRVCKFCDCEVDAKAKYQGEHCPKKLW